MKKTASSAEAVFLISVKVFTSFLLPRWRLRDIPFSQEAEEHSPAA
ncbi:hypothetical protein K7T73_13635 [Bacillus badius]|nr:hypothetical protein [Bacillus badius]UAT29634.1 hypothetical protein K7T73_13635 [Bacillus badius]